jgi:hypothetical protein
MWFILLMYLNYVFLILSLAYDSVCSIDQWTTYILNLEFGKTVNRK